MYVKSTQKKEGAWSAAIGRLGCGAASQAGWGGCGGEGRYTLTRRGRMASFGPPPPAAQSSQRAKVGAERSASRSSAAAPAGAQARWRQAKVASPAAGKVGAWQRVVAQSAGEDARAGGAALSPATARFQSRLKEAEQIIIALREQAQLLQVQLDDSRSEAADAGLQLELVLAEAMERGMDLRG